MWIKNSNRCKNKPRTHQKDNAVKKILTRYQPAFQRIYKAFSYLLKIVCHKSVNVFYPSNKYHCKPFLWMFFLTFASQNFLPVFKDEQR